MTQQKTQNTKRIHSTWILIVICVGLVWAGRIFMGAPPGIKIDPSPRSKGNPQASYRLVEYFDFQCPSCALASEIMDEYITAYPKDIYLEHRYFPLSGHRFGLRSALYAHCALKQDKYWPMHDLLMKHQAEWRVALEAEPFFQNYAKKIGMEGQALGICLESSETKSQVMADRDSGLILGIRSTPAFIVDGALILGHRNLKTELEKRFPDGLPD
jgi:protein-disulfide isomerase